MPRSGRTGSQSRHFKHDPIADAEPRPGGQSQQVDAAGGDILPQIARPDDMALGPQLREEFGLDEMHLPQIGLVGIGGYAGAVLNAAALMGIALDA